jgi:hypothetical protein
MLPLANEEEEKTLLHDRKGNAKCISNKSATINE